MGRPPSGLEECYRLASLALSRPGNSTAGGSSALSLFVGAAPAGSRQETRRLRLQGLPEIDVAFPVVPPQELPLFILRWGFEYRAKVKQALRPAYEKILAISDRLGKGQPPTPQELEFIDSVISDCELGLERFKQDMQRMAESQTDRESPAVEMAIHDARRRGDVFAGLIKALSYFRKRRLPLDDRWKGILQDLPTNALSLAFVEARDLAYDDIFWAHLHYRGLAKEELDGIYLRDDVDVAVGIQDIMANLLSNAARYHRERPETGTDDRLVEITTAWSADGSLEVTVSDNGIGMSPDFLDRLGEAGSREGRKEVAGSSGLGLASVIDTLRRLGWGPLWVKSRPGEGTEFRFNIPAGDLGRVKAKNEGSVSSLEKNLKEGFLVPAASMDLALKELLEKVSPE